RSGNILRFPRAAGEPPRARRVASVFVDAALLADRSLFGEALLCAYVLRGLTYAFLPAGVYVYFLRSCSVLFFWEWAVLIMSQPHWVKIHRMRYVTWI